MNAKEHLNFYLYSATLLVAGFEVSKHMNIDIDIIEVLIGGGVGSLLPDIDHKNGTLSKIIPLYVVHDLLKKVKIYAFKHGGITHTLLVNLLIAGFGIYYKNYLVLGISFGYWTHLYIDHVTGNKLSMLYFPFKRKGGE